MGDEDGSEDRVVDADDGLKLYGKIYGRSDGTRLPIVCLPGLTRSAADFDGLARRLAGTRRVVCLDYRGRGLSASDPEWQHYSLDVEGRDIETFLSALAIPRAVFVGTSRGGLHLMRFAHLGSTRIAAAVLNDIGPVIEVAGLRRIRGYVGVGAPPATQAESIAAVKAAAGGRFPALSAADWTIYADMSHRRRDGSYGRLYDAHLARTLKGLDLDAPQPTLWPQFESLAGRPLLVVRGETSDLLSPATLSEMVARHPACRTHIVPGQGHAPLLIDAPTLDRISAFVDEID